jgi:hypothetical protein
LRSDLKWALAGSLALATGQAWLQPLAWLGGALWAWVLGRMWISWVRLYRSRIFGWHGAAPLLAAASTGFACALSGTLVGSGAPLSLFLPGFLMPLLAGAASQLLPVWSGPGRSSAWQSQSRQCMTCWNGVRALLFLTTALLALCGYPYSAMPALAALVWFGAGLAFCRLHVAEQPT